MADAASYARAAFAIGWAQSEADWPPDEAAIRDCRIICELARQHPGDSALLAEARRVGTHAALLSAVARVREEVHTHAHEALAPLLAALAAIMHPEDLLAVMTAGERAAVRQANAAAASTELAHRLGQEPDLHQRFRRAASEVVGHAAAMGAASAVAVLTHSAKALSAPPESDAGGEVSDQAVTAVLTGAGYDAASAYGGGNGPDASPSTDHQDLLRAAVAGVGAGYYAQSSFDAVVGGAFVTASLAAYRASGTAYVDWETMAGACSDCSDLAIQGPYQRDMAPQCPDHPRCRCWLAPATGP